MERQPIERPLDREALTLEPVRRRRATDDRALRGGRAGGRDRRQDAEVRDGDGWHAALL